MTAIPERAPDDRDAGGQARPAVLRHLTAASLGRGTRARLALMAPLGTALYALSKSAFSLLGRRYRRRARTHAEVCRWTVLGEQLARAVTVPYLMVTAPRWNTHALICSAGPFALDGSPLRFDRAALDASAAVWALVIYRARDKATMASVSSTGPITEPVLPRDVYGIGLRLYKPAPEVRLPGLYEGERPIVSAHTLTTSALADVAERVRNRSSLYYRLLHSPVLRRLAKRPPEDDVVLARSYLPVGNPETLFVFGVVPRGAVVVIDASDIGENEAFVFASTYNLASFPLQARETGAGSTTRMDGMPEDGTVVVRVIPRSGSAADNATVLQRLQVSIDRG